MVMRRRLPDASEMARGDRNFPAAFIVAEDGAKIGIGL